MKYKENIMELIKEIDNDAFWKFIYGIIIKFKTRWGL